MDFDLNESADKLAKALDDGTSEEDVAQLFQQELSDAGSRENRQALVSEVDSRERDYLNLDLIVKKDEIGTPIAYTIQPNALHESAKRMAGMMDAGNLYEAMALGSEVKSSFGGSRDESRDRNLRFGRWSIAVDAYDDKSKGYNVDMKYLRGGSVTPAYPFPIQVHRDSP